MFDLSNEPARVTRQRAMELLCIADDKVFAKVVDANPELVHKLPGETRARYRTDIIARLLNPTSGVRPSEGRAFKL